MEHLPPPHRVQHLPTPLPNSHIRTRPTRKPKHNSDRISKRPSPPHHRNTRQTRFRPIIQHRLGDQSSVIESCRYTEFLRETSEKSDCGS
jgi:hypothetical protein